MKKIVLCCSNTLFRQITPPLPPPLKNYTIGFVNADIYFRLFGVDIKQWTNCRYNLFSFDFFKGYFLECI